MIRVAILDRHPATRAGLDAILRAAPGLVPVGAAAGRRELWPLLYRTDPDVVVIDELRLCLAIRARRPRARVVLHAVGAGFDLIVPAAFAGASAMVDKSATTSELVAAIRGDVPLPPITPRMQRRAAERLDGSDRAILAMRLAGTPDREITEIVGLPREALAARCAEIVSGAVGALDRPRELHAG
jgi:DNA-binding NarL/FixJ family response regulator